MLGAYSTGVANRTPGTWDTAWSTAPLNVPKLLVLRMTRLEWKVWSIASFTEPRVPAAKIVTNVTRARPIISAAAVTAVRPGLRMAFSRARRPVSPVSRSSGRPTTEASGRTSWEDSMPTPRNTTTAPAPRSPATEPPDPTLPNSP